MRRLTIATVGVAVGFALALNGGIAAAKPKKRTVQPQSVTRPSDVAEIVFSEVERRLIGDYFGVPTHGGGGPGKQMPPGLAKRDQLPPGLAKRDQLPPGLAKRDLPSDLERRLGLPRHGTKRLIVGNDVLLVEAATGIVLDIIYDVVTRRN